MVFCGDGACRELNITAQNAEHVKLSCVGYDACYSANLFADDSQTEVICSGMNTCEMLQVNENTEGSGTLNITCDGGDGPGACRESYFYCPKGDTSCFISCGKGMDDRVPSHRIYAIINKELILEQIIVVRGCMFTSQEDLTLMLS